MRNRAATSGGSVGKTKKLAQSLALATVAVTAAYFALRGRIKLRRQALKEIVERKRAEETLRQSEEKYRTLFETMAQGVVYQDATGKITSANPAAEGILGLTLGQILGRTLVDPRWRAIHEDGSDFPGDTHPAMVALKTGIEVRNVVMGVFHPKEERYHWINISAVPQFKPGERKPYQVYTTFDDITERKRQGELSEALNNIGGAIVSTFDFNEIMRRVVVESAKAIGCESAAIYLHEADCWVLRYFYGLPEELAGTAITGEEARGLVLATRERRSIVSNDAYRDERLNREIMRKYSIRSLLTVPLITKGEPIGALSFYYRSTPVAFTDAEIDFANKLASAISLALENARLYETERNIADTLQESLLTIPQEIENIDFGYLYRSATEATRVGGDFYDLFELEHGRVGITIGDVSGKGLEAATLTSLVKNSIKAYAYQEDSPASIMAKVNDVVRKESGPTMFVTVFFGILDAKTGHLVYCNAGHPPPILRKKEEALLLAASSPIIGVFAGLNYIDDEDTLEKGDILILYTDGIPEARCNGGFFGDERFVNFVSNLEPRRAREIPQIIFNKVMSCTRGKLSDDIALLAISLAD